MKPLSPGTRIRVNERAGWPERVGLEGVVVDPPEPGTYPDGFARYEVLVLLDEDPLTDAMFTSYRERYGARYDHDRGWTCVLNSNAVDVVSGVGAKQP